MQISRSVIIPTTQPSLSTMGMHPQSFSHIICAALLRVVNVVQLLASGVIKSLTFIRLSSQVHFSPIKHRRGPHLHPDREANTSFRTFSFHPRPDAKITPIGLGPTKLCAHAEPGDSVAKHPRSQALATVAREGFSRPPMPRKTRRVCPTSQR